MGGGKSSVSEVEQVEEVEDVELLSSVVVVVVEGAEVTAAEEEGASGGWEVSKEVEEGVEED